MHIKMKTEWILVFLVVLKICHDSEATSVNNTEVNCGNLTCASGSRCTNGTVCQCFQGYMGDTCYTDIDECANGHGACLNRGYCHNSIGSYWCVCVSGWQPTEHCEIPDAPDGNRTCVEGYLGDWCNNTCLNTSMCGSNAKCINRGGVHGLHCRCDPGYSGISPNCSDIDECKTFPCSNSGTCVNTPGSYHCDCKLGWSGSSCTNDVDECNTTNPCQNFGSCKNTKGSFDCNCTAGWIGKICNIIDHCASSPCNNSATCQNKNGNFECTCTLGWNGTSCNMDVDECLQSKCLNSGQCINSPGSFICNCSSGWEGEVCEKYIGGEGNGSKTNVGVVVGAVLGSLLLLACLLVAVLIARHKWVHRKVKDTTDNTDHKDNHTAQEHVSQGPSNPKIKLV